MIQYIDSVTIENKKVLLRVDFNVSLNVDASVKNDERIKRAVPTIKRLLDTGNKLLLVSHLGQPKAYDAALTTERLAVRLQEYIEQTVTFVPFANPFALVPDTSNVYMLDNIRFHPGEKKNDPEFARQLASLTDVYVNDAFGVCHRPDASVVGVPALLPHFGGLLLKQEVEMIRKAIVNPPHPVVAVIGGSKVSTKIGLIEKLMELADYVLIGGAMTNNFLKVQGHEIGKGLFEPEFVEEARRLLELDKTTNKIRLPVDRRIGSQTDETSEPAIKSVSEVGVEDETLDIGPETEKLYADIIAQAKTIIWNGPVGYFENSKFARGSLAIFKAITENTDALSVVGGGDTLTVIKKQPNQENITHISTGGGAMLELVEKGTLPGIEALKN